MKKLEQVTGSTGKKYWISGNNEKIACECMGFRVYGRCRHVKKWKKENPDWKSKLSPPDKVKKKPPTDSKPAIPPKSWWDKLDKKDE